MIDELIYYTALSYNDYIGPKRFLKIKENFNKLEDFFQLSSIEQMDFIGLKNPESQKKFDSMLTEGERIITVCHKKGIKIISAEDPVYPPKLHLIPDPPFLFYQLGEINYSSKLIAIVGTREVSPEAVLINQHFAKDLISYNIGIISGLAKGHDMIAQKTAIDNEGYTIAVLGSGVDVIYPKESKELYLEIKVKGALISEYPPGSLPLPQYFPYRNRIISGLSDAVLVIQAPEKSGALITAKYAEIQGKDLYVVPGNPTAEKYAGSNKLIQNGAKMALNPEDIAIDLLGKKAEKIKKLNISNLPDITKEEKIVLQNLNTETYIDDITELTGLSISQLNHILTKLEIRGLVIQYPGRYYMKNELIKI